MASIRMAVCVTADPAVRRTVRRTLQAADIPSVFVTDHEDVFAHAASKPFLVAVDHSGMSVSQIHDLIGRIDWEATVAVLADLEKPAEMLGLLEHDRCNNLLDRSEPMAEDELMVTSIKILSQDIFGLEKYITWGTPVREIAVSTYDEKRAAIEEVAGFAQAVGCRRRAVARIEIVADELLMNALYDAPASRFGQKRSAYLSRAVPRGGPVTDRPATLRYACDGRHMIISVVDGFGELRKRKIVEHLKRATEQRGRPLGDADAGAGLGLYFIMSSVTRFVANIEPGVTTEVICLLDLRRPSTGAHSPAGSVNIFISPG